MILAAGTFNTQRLMHHAKTTTLPQISDAMGRLTRTNSESILGAMGSRVDPPEHDYSRGVAITSSFYPEPNTHIEPVRYGKGSNAIAYLQTLLTDGGTRRNRFGQFLKQVAKNPFLLVRLLVVRQWSERTVIALVMQNNNNSLTTFVRKRGGPLRYVTSKQATANRTRRGFPRATRQLDGWRPS